MKKKKKKEKKEKKTAREEEKRGKEATTGLTMPKQWLTEAGVMLPN